MRTIFHYVDLEGYPGTIEDAEEPKFRWVSIVLKRRRSAKNYRFKPDDRAKFTVRLPTHILDFSGQDVSDQIAEAVYYGSTGWNEFQALVIQYEGAAFDGDMQRLAMLHGHFSDVLREAMKVLTEKELLDVMNEVMTRRGFRPILAHRFFRLTKSSPIAPPKP